MSQWQQTAAEAASCHDDQDFAGATRHCASLAELIEALNQELEEQRHTVIEIAQQAELDESVVAVEPPVSSGLPVPRLITCLPEANRCVCCGTSH